MPANGIPIGTNKLISDNNPNAPRKVLAKWNHLLHLSPQTNRLSRTSFQLCQILNRKN